MTTDEVRVYHLSKLDADYASLRKLAADPRFTDATSEEYRRTVGALLERTQGIAAFNAVCLPAGKAHEAAAKVGNGKPAKVPLPGGLLDAILGAPESRP